MPVDMGLFGASGVEETHMNMQDSRFNGLPFNRMERRAVIIVRRSFLVLVPRRLCSLSPYTQHWQSFSPLNAQIRLSENMPWHSFFLVTRCELTPHKQVSVR
jgi:hypothetical protein